MNILGIIPARFYSTRLEGKSLIDIGGKTMIRRVYEQCLQVEKISDLIVATDDYRIFNEVERFGGHVMMTSTLHQNGTERCAEVLRKYQEENKKNIDFVINIQGDEPFINPKQIDEFIELFEDNNAQIFTQVHKITAQEEIENPNVVKCIFDEKYYALAFNRNSFSSDVFYKHIGIYGFRSAVLNEIVHLKPTEAELQHKLEQLRWLDNRYKIKVGITSYTSLSIDTLEDLEKAKLMFGYA